MHYTRYLIFLTGLFLLSSAMQAQTFVLNGSTSALGGNCFQLTPDNSGQAGSMFSTNPIDLTQPFSFDAVFYFGNKDVNGADGIVFILATTNTALGVGGGGMGYQGITPSIAIEYDDYFNGGFNDPTQDHIAITSMGNLDHNAPTNLAGPITIGNIEDGEDHCFSFLWDPVSQTFAGDLDGESIFYNGDIINTIFGGNPLVYFGFSSGTGSLSNQHTVCFGPPQLIPMPDVTVCQGESVTLEADPNGIAWQWAAHPTLTPLNVSDPTATPVITTSYTVRIDYPCGGLARDTVVVTVNPTPTVTTDNTSPVCPEESVTLMATGGTAYQWSGPMGFNSSLQNPTITSVTTAKTGTYTVTVTDAAGCTNTATTTVQLYPPTLVEIDPLAGPLCEVGDAVQLFAIPSGGIWTGEIDPNGVFHPMNAGEGLHTITYTITDANGCDYSDEIVIKVVPNVPAEILPTGPFCSSEGTVTLTANPPGGIWGGEANSDGEIYPFIMDIGQNLITYMLTGQDECYNTEISIEIIEVPPVVICPGNIPVLCEDDDTFTISALPPGGVWSGNGITADGVIDPSILGPGSHQVVYTHNGGGPCIGNSCWSLVEIIGSPQFQNVIVTCDVSNAFYTVSFSIEGGDPASYHVEGSTNGALIPGTPYSFVSDPIPSGAAYQFSLFDDVACDTNLINGSYSCNCPTNAGMMDQTPIQVCSFDTAFILPATGFTLESDDTLIYVLHTGDPFNFLQASSDLSFVLQPPLQTGITYFISAMAGNNLGMSIDLSDPCLSVVLGPTVAWMPDPSGDISAPPLLCLGDMGQLMFTLNGGPGPFYIVYSDGTDTITVDSILPGYGITVQPMTTTTYHLLSVFDYSGPGCGVVFDSTATIQVGSFVQAAQDIRLCPGDSLFVEGEYQYTAGEYIDTIASGFGCDTVLVTSLSFFNPDTTRLTDASCHVADTGVFENILTNVHGCDSVVITTVTFIEPDSTFVDAFTCDPGMAGMFIDIFLSQEGCDSFLVRTVHLLTGDTTYLTSTTCDPAQAGVTNTLMQNQLGCDSLIIETTSLLPSDTVFIEGYACMPSDTGLFVTTLLNRFGCDSIVSEQVLLAPTYVFSSMAETCDPSAAGFFTQTFQTGYGCDSVYNETVLLLPSDTNTFVVTTCIAAETGTQTVYHTNVAGCDSLEITFTVLAPADSCRIDREVYIPNIFSPNLDGYNDVFLLFARPDVLSRILYMRIFDRWGGLVVEHGIGQPNDLQYGWDGKMDGRECNPGVYAWVIGIEYTDGLQSVLYGDVTLIK